MLTAMITPSHIIYNWAFGQSLALAKRAKLALVMGGFLPDLPTYLFFAVHTFFIGTSQQTLWDTTYFESDWSTVITLSHSLILWPLAFAIGLFLQRTLLKFVALGGLIHVTMDFFVHNDDAYRHFWPLTEWKFMSPVSYWDPAHFGTLVGAVDSVVIIALLLWLYNLVGQRLKLVIIGSMVFYVLQLVASFFIF